MGLTSSMKSVASSFAKLLVFRDRDRNPAANLIAARDMAYTVPEAPATLSVDVSRTVPLLWQVVDGTIRDVDELIAQDPDGYGKIYADEHISAQIDNLMLPIAQASWSLVGSNDDSDRLAKALEPVALKVRGWQSMILELAHAVITGVRIVRPVFERRSVKGYDAFVPKRWNFKDKRRFRPEDPDWNEFYLHDPGYIAGDLTDYIGFSRRMERRWFIIARWRDTEDRLGWGHGLGERLYRLREIRNAVMNICLRSVEAHAGGIRIVTPDLMSFKGQSPSQQQAILEAIVSTWRDAESGDTVAFAPGTEARVEFPENSVGQIVNEIIDGYVDKKATQLLTGVTLTTDQGSVGSYELGKVHAAEKHQRMQFIAEWIAETLDTEWLPMVLAINPWVYEAAGVPFGTPLPQFEARVRGSDSLLQRIQAANQIRVAVNKTDYMRFVTDDLFAVASDEEVQKGDAFIPAMAGPDAMGGGSGSTPGGLAGGIGAGLLDGLDLGDAAPVDADGNTTANGEEIAAAGLEPPTTQEVSLMYDRAVKAKDRWLADFARRKLASMMGEDGASVPPISDEEWERMTSGGGAPGMPGGGGMPGLPAPKGEDGEPAEGDDGPPPNLRKRDDYARDPAGKFSTTDSGGGGGGSEKPSGKGVASKAKKAAGLAWTAINAAPKAAEAIVKETGASPRVAKIAMYAAMAGDWALPGAPAGSLTVAALATIASGGKAPAKAASKAWKQWKERRGDRAAMVARSAFVVWMATRPAALRAKMLTEQQQATAKDIARAAAKASDPEWFAMLVAAARAEGAEIAEAIEFATDTTEAMPTMPAGSDRSRLRSADEYERDPDGKFATKGSGGSSGSDPDEDDDSDEDDDDDGGADNGDSDGDEEAPPPSWDGWDGADAAEWSDAGFEQSEAEAWSEVGKEIGAEDATAWRDAGFDPTSAAGWIGRGVDAKEAQAWNAAGVDLDTYDDWSAYADPSDIGEWTKLTSDVDVVHAANELLEQDRPQAGVAGITLDDLSEESRDLISGYGDALKQIADIAGKPRFKQRLVDNLKAFAEKKTDPTHAAAFADWRLDADDVFGEPISEDAFSGYSKLPGADKMKDAGYSEAAFEAVEDYLGKIAKKNKRARWITIGSKGEDEGGGRPVLIDENGNIIGGSVPKGWQGKSVSDASTYGGGKAKENSDADPFQTHDEYKKEVEAELDAKGDPFAKDPEPDPDGAFETKEKPKRDPKTQAVIDTAEAYQAIAGRDTTPEERDRIGKAAEKMAEHADNPKAYWGSADQPYWKPGPNPTVDAVITRDGPNGKQVLMIQRGPNGAEANKWALPGGFHDSAGGARGEWWKPGKESAEDAALRELIEETGLDASQVKDTMKHVGVFDEHGRDPRDNEYAWAVSNAYSLHLDGDLAEAAVSGQDDAQDAQWVDVADLDGMELAFDHGDILGKAGVRGGDDDESSPADAAWESAYQEARDKASLMDSAQSAEDYAKTMSERAFAQTQAKTQSSKKAQQAADDARQQALADWREVNSNKFKGDSFAWASNQAKKAAEQAEKGGSDEQ